MWADMEETESVNRELVEEGKPPQTVLYYIILH